MNIEQLEQDHDRQFTEEELDFLGLLDSESKLDHEILESFFRDEIEQCEDCHVVHWEVADNLCSRCFIEREGGIDE